MTLSGFVPSIASFGQCERESREIKSRPLTLTALWGEPTFSGHLSPFSHAVHNERGCMEIARVIDFSALPFAVNAASLLNPRTATCEQV